MKGDRGRYEMVALYTPEMIIHNTMVAHPERPLLTREVSQKWREGSQSPSAVFEAASLVNSGCEG